MARQRHTAEEIINKLREAEVGLAKGMAVLEVCRKLGVTEQTYYRWRKEYGGLSRDQAKRLRKQQKRRIVRFCKVPRQRHPRSRKSYASARRRALPAAQRHPPTE